MAYQNAVIEETMLGFEDHGILTWFIYVKLSEGGHQGFGGWSLATPKFSDNRDKTIKGPPYATITIEKILEVAGVSRWEKLVGQPIRVEKAGALDRITGIAHLLDDDKTFVPDYDFERLQKGMDV